MNMNMIELRKEIDNARNCRMSRAALGSIIRRFVPELKEMSFTDKKIWLYQLGFNESIYAEIMKELSIAKYERLYYHGIH